MAEYKAISFEQDKSNGWSKFQNIEFASKFGFVQINFAEISSVMQEYPIVFAKVNETSYKLAVLLGTAKDENLFVNENFKWNGGYVPNYLKQYPFAIIEQDGKVIVCFDMESGLYQEDGVYQSFQFFDEEGNPSEVFGKKINFLQKYYENQKLTQKMVDILAKYELFTPMKLEFDGIYRIDEAKLNALEGEALKELQNSNALSVVYGHLFSLQKVKKLKKLAAKKQEASQLVEDMDLDALFKNDMINF